MPTHWLFTVTNATPGITALFGALKSNQVSLTVLPNGNGTVAINPASNVYTNGDTVTLTAIPDAGRTFHGWGGDATSTNNPLLITMNQSKSITADFTTPLTLSVGTPLEGLVENGFRLTLSGEIGGQYHDFGLHQSAGLATGGDGYEHLRHGPVY